MNAFIANDVGRIVVIHLKKGEKILENIQSKLDELGIKNGILLSAIGSVRKVCLHGITTTEDLPTNKYVTIEGPIELASMQGIILNGEPHFHIVCSDLERAYTGHLENGCEVQYLAEFTIMEIKDMNLTRKLDEFGISYIDKL